MTQALTTQLELIPLYEHISIYPLFPLTIVCTPQVQLYRTHLLHLGQLKCFTVSSDSFSPFGPELKEGPNLPRSRRSMKSSRSKQANLAAPPPPDSSHVGFCAPVLFFLCKRDRYLRNSNTETRFLCLSAIFDRSDPKSEFQEKQSDIACTTNICSVLCKEISRLTPVGVT